jgi:hypothetical protein
LFLRDIGVETHFGEFTDSPDRFKKHPDDAYLKSLGDQWVRVGVLIVSILEGPIREAAIHELFVNPYDDPSYSYWYITYGVPDARIGPDSPPAVDRSVTSFFRGAPALRPLRLLNNAYEISFRSDIDQGRWIIDPGKNCTNEDMTQDFSVRPQPDYLSLAHILEQLAPTREEWNAYQAIARILLETPIPADTLSD